MENFFSGLNIDFNYNLDVNLISSCLKFIRNHRIDMKTTNQMLTNRC